MIYPLSFTNQSTNSSQKSTSLTQGTKAKENEYKDPLANNWLNIVLYSTELGALVHEISPKTAQALWIPTIMYLGADIYDKYKNDKNHFSPSGKRGVEQAIYQGVAGFLLPAGTVFVGQKLTSPIGKLVNKGLSVNAKEATLNHIRNSLDQCVGDRFKNYKNFENFVINSLENTIQAQKNDKYSDGFLKRLIKFCHKKYPLAQKDTDKIFEFARKNIKDLYQIKEALAAGNKPQHISKKTYDKFIESSSQLKATYGKDYSNDALRYALKSYQNKLIMQNKLIKTFGGIIALAITLKPIYAFVQKTFIPKFVDPNIDRFNRLILDTSKLKQHINPIAGGVKPENANIIEQKAK